MGLHFYLAQTPIATGSTGSSYGSGSDTSNNGHGNGNSASCSVAAPLAFLEQDICTPAFIQQCVSKHRAAAPPRVLRDRTGVAQAAVLSLPKRVTLKRSRLVALN